MIATRPRLLLLHGALGAARQWASMKPHLEAAFDLHTIEFEGHGDTPTKGRPYRIEHFAENVVAHLDAHDIATTAIFGYSMGGYVALWLARHRPERVRAVATLGTKLAWTPEVAAKEASRLVPDVMRAKIPQFAAMLEARHARAGGWERVVSATAEMMRALGEAPPLDDAQLAQIQQPVRLMLGDRDAMVTLDETVKAYRQIPTGELAVLPRTPHPLEQVDPVRLAAAISDAVAHG
jgi:pimeloyl-ACP methyl ester carboxylesterase